MTAEGTEIQLSDCHHIFPDIGPHTGGSETARKQEEVWRQRIQETGQQSGGETDVGSVWFITNYSLYRTPWRREERQILDK